MQAQATRPRISAADQITYQARACQRLANILSTAAERALPAIPWTVTAVGCGLRADITPAGAADPRGTHRAWVQALGLTPQRTMPGRLTATVRMDGVQVTITTALTKENA
ncbi:hypothetical protein ACLQ2R_17645 [Streptosporangium sp. DT93]|uniref:hypothetical protein n=1 Tax=Streptosporangium sp. DT93 TaxID=3393428 RepID=UPI003CEFA784